MTFESELIVPVNIVAKIRLRRMRDKKTRDGGTHGRSVKSVAVTHHIVSANRTAQKRRKGKRRENALNCEKAL